MAVLSFLASLKAQLIYLIIYIRLLFNKGNKVDDLVPD